MQVTATQLSQYVELKVLLGDAIPTYNCYLLLLLLFLTTTIRNLTSNANIHVNFKILNTAMFSITGANVVK